jgi:hypothetical protein
LYENEKGKTQNDDILTRKEKEELKKTDLFKKVFEHFLELKKAENEKNEIERKIENEKNEKQRQRKLELL